MKCNVDVDTLINLLPAKDLADLCGISRSFCYILLKKYSKATIFKTYCNLVLDKCVQ